MKEDGVGFADPREAGFNVSWDPRLLGGIRNGRPVSKQDKTSAESKKLFASTRVPKDAWESIFGKK